MPQIPPLCFRYSLNSLIDLEEGIIKYDQEWIRKPIGRSDMAADLLKLREDLYRRQWIGTYPDGIGYGNVSVRLNDNDFLITGSGTGNLTRLTLDQLSLVTEADISANRLSCTGLVPASSEALSHAAIYQTDFEIGCVIHIHDSRLWKQLLNKAPTIAEDIPYGTSAMAAALTEMVLTHYAENELIVTAGHIDGIFTYGKTCDDAWQALLNWSL